MSLKLFNRQADPTVSAYSEQFSLFRRGVSSVKDATFLVLDIETTGFDPWRDKIVSIAWMKVIGSELLVESAKSSIIYQKPSVDLKESSEIHGLLHEQLKDGRELKEVLAELLQDASDSIIVGHHIGFDLRMLNQALQTHYKINLKNRSLDTAFLAMQICDAFKKTGYSNQRPPSLDEVCSHCDLVIEDRHTAEGDVLATAQLLLLMLARMQVRSKKDMLMKELPLRRASSS